MTNEGNSYSNQWIPLLPSAEMQIGLATAYESALHWAMIKMNEETKLKELLDKHPGLEDLKEKYEVMLALVQKNELHDDK